MHIIARDFSPNDVNCCCFYFFYRHIIHKFSKKKTFKRISSLSYHAIIKSSENENKKLNRASEEEEKIVKWNHESVEWLNSNQRRSFAYTAKNKSEYFFIIKNYKKKKLLITDLIPEHFFRWMLGSSSGEWTLSDGDLNAWINSL